MKTVLISNFKTHCIQLLKDVNEHGEPLLITIRGKPIARVEPVGQSNAKRVLGALRGQIEITGDIVNTDLSDDWEATASP